MRIPRELNEDDDIYPSFEEYNEESENDDEEDNEYYEEESPEEPDIVPEEEVIETVYDFTGVPRIDASKLEELIPAQSFINGKAITTVFLPQIRETMNGRMRVATPFLITSAREKIYLNHEELLNLGYYYNRTPSHDTRWSNDSVIDFLNGKKLECKLSDVFKMIIAQYESHIDFGDKRWNEVLACWVIGTYFHRAFSTYPYLHLNGNMAAGKSKTLLLSMLLAFNGEVSVGATASYITRTIHDNNSSFGIDESERLGGKDDNYTVLAIYNAGYKRGTYIGKSESSEKNGWVRKQFDAYSPKIFSGIKRLSPTLASRTIPITMVKTGNKDIKNNDVDIEDRRYQDIRNHLYFAMMENFEGIINTYKELTDETIVGRDFELWRPILAVAQYIDPALYANMREFAIDIQEQKKEIIEEDTSVLKFLEALLFFITEVKRKDDPYYTVQEIQDFLSNPSLNPESIAFTWMQGKSCGKYIGDELRKSGVVKGSAVQHKVDGVNKRCFFLTEEIIENSLKLYRES